jgi:uncharacterized protein YbjT (DUF2867 family)
MNIILFGATGMVGAGALLECLDDARVASVLVIGRRSVGLTHPKLREALRTDFLRYDDARETLAGYDACFFCLGVSAARLDEATYRRLTHDLTLAAARTLAEVNPGITFCYVSGEGTDSTERGRFMWARVKGRTENELLRMPGLVPYLFRPGYIHPLRGVRSRFRLYRAAHVIAGPLYPLIGKLFPTHVTTTVNVGRALLEVAANGYSKRVLENADINAIGGSHDVRRP